MFAYEVLIQAFGKYGIIHQQCVGHLRFIIIYLSYIFITYIYHYTFIIIYLSYVFIIYNDAIHQLDKLSSFPAIAFELFSSMARALGFITEGLRVRVSPSASEIHLQPV